MNNYHDVHSWSRLYREERLSEARMRHLEARLREDREARSGRGPVGLALANVLSLVRGA
jgi:hypothetical protein